MNLAGLAFSGGGIRAATFAVGFLQGLSTLGLLSRFDYLSTVSGGGYAGGWLAAWLFREGQTTNLKCPLRNVEMQLAVSRATQAKAQRRFLNPTGNNNPAPEPLAVDEEPEPVHHLREYSSYMAPRMGLFTMDTWAILMTWSRNVATNMMMLFPAAMLLVLAARAIVYAYTNVTLALINSGDPAHWWRNVALAALVVGLFLLGCGFWNNAKALKEFRRAEPLSAQNGSSPETSAGETAIFCKVILPVLIAALLVTCTILPLLNWLGIGVQDLAMSGASSGSSFWASVKIWIGEHLQFIGLPNILLHAVVVGLLTMIIALIAAKARRWFLRAAFLAGASGGLLFAVAESLLNTCGDGQRPDLLATFAVPSVLLVLVAAAVVEVALLGRLIEEAEREWWARLCAGFGIAAIVWMVTIGTVVYAPAGLLMAGPLARSVIASGWLLTTAATMLSGRLGSTGLWRSKFALPLPLLATVAPPVFVIGLLALVASLVAFLTNGKSPAPMGGGTLDAAQIWGNYLAEVQNTHWLSLVSYAVLMCIFFRIAENRIVVNLFSLNSMYANRLVRCYLGASRPNPEWKMRWENYGPNVFCGAPTGVFGGKQVDRKPNPFTGFDRDDDIPLSELRPPHGDDPLIYWGPLPLINATLNRVAGKELAWRDRKGESFLLSPLYCGTRETGYSLCPRDVSRCDLRLVSSLNNLSELPKEGKNQVIVAALNKVLHIRIFDSGGEMVVDTSEVEEKEAVKKSAIEKLRKKLESLWPSHELADSEKLEVIAAVTSIVGHSHEDSRNLTLGRAMSISGAAVDPNMGYLQSPMLTVFLTVLNARLGYWMQRPVKLGWKASGPTSGGGLLLRELLGLTDAKSEFVHLSDGGHFENLGVYELIRRRCRFIVALDSGEDGNPSNDNLTTLVRLCRIDFGVRIQINTDPLRMSGDGRLTSTHVVIGRVRYDDVDDGEKEGMLVYVKISLTGDEPPDVQGFAARNPDFPHEATDLRQSFDEERFEAYRNLGDHIARRVFQRPKERSMYEMYGKHLWDEGNSDEEFCCGNARLFGAVARVWSVPPALQSSDYIQGTRDWIALQRVLLKNETLALLAYELYPEFVPDPGPLEGEERDRAKRAAFHAVGVMTQIMESTWLALNPNSDVDQPMNQGWLNAFRRWTTTRTFRRFWATYRSEFSPDFRQFCESSLHLGIAPPQAATLADLQSLGEAMEPAVDRLAEEFRREWPGDEEPLRDRIERAEALDPDQACYIVQAPTGPHAAHSEDAFVCGVILLLADKSNGFDLRLMSSLNDVSAIPTEGKDLIIVAEVNNVLHFRIFYGNGKPDVDTDERRLAGKKPQIEKLREKLDKESLWFRHVLTDSEKRQVIDAVTLISGRLEFFVWIRPPHRSIGLGSQLVPPKIDEVVNNFLKRDLIVRYPRPKENLHVDLEHVAWRKFFVTNGFSNHLEEDTSGSYVLKYNGRAGH